MGHRKVESNQEKLQNLRSYEILDASSVCLDGRLAELAAEVCGTEHAAISLFEEETECFFATHHLDFQQIPLEASVSARNLSSKGPLGIRDMREGLLNAFSDKGFVSYAGTALLSPGGAVIGALCVLDREPRDFDSKQLGNLECLARQISAQITDLVARKESDLLLFQEKERARVTLNTIADGVVCTDSNDRVTYLNSRAEVMTGRRNSEAMGQKVSTVVKLHEGPKNQLVKDVVTHALAGESDDCTLKSRDGRDFSVESSASPMFDANGANVGNVIVFHDVSEAREMAMRMAHLAQHDSLTNLPNRFLLQEKLLAAVEKSSRLRDRFAIVFLDLDHFKTINDSMGHAVGDQLLKEIAARISNILRGTDTVCRQGGDEFILVLTEVGTKEEAALIVQRILRSVSAPYRLEVGSTECKLNATFSAGIAVYPENGLDSDTLMRRADTAMYLAKQSGRNRYQFFSEDLDDTVMARHTMFQDMREAIDCGDFFAEYQPKIATVGREIVGVEALVRWQKADGSVVSPAEFIPLAEESGLIVEIGHQVLERACVQCMAWEKAGLPPITMAVNVSAVQLASPDFVEKVAKVLHGTGMLAGRLELEITESSIMADVEKAVKVLHQLRDLGIRVSLDDFGTGYSSLSYLRTFPLDSLKIDRSFVSDLTTSSSTAAIMETICNLAAILNLQTVAEGVETEEQAALLSNLQCTAMQGYLFSRPVSGTAIAAMLRKSAESIAA